MDSKIEILIRNIINLYQRGIFVIIGDRGKDQVINLCLLHSKLLNMINSEKVKAKNKILWCYKNELGFSTHQKKRLKEISLSKKQGLYDAQSDNLLDQFINNNLISYRYYKDSHKILGETYNFLILQDFEGITPNLLCRTIETVQGGGMVYILIKSLKNLKQLYNLTFDINHKLKSDNFQNVEPRFIERFFLSLSTNKHCLFIDDEMNVLKISSVVENLELVDSNDYQNKNDAELKKLFENIKNEPIIGKLLPLSKTLDQAKALLQLIKCISDDNKNSLFLNASRGRGKSAVLGLFLSACLSLGKSNLFLTAPTTDNIKTVFEFIIKGLIELGYKDKMDFEKYNDDEGNVCKIILIGKIKQIVSYIKPNDYSKVYNAELVVIDEAAAIDINIIKKFIGPYPLFLSSTIHGYEGTGRSLSNKLIKEMRENKKGLKYGLKDCNMELPIRYSDNDVVENWLYDLLLLRATIPQELTSSLPHPENCNLYLVNKNTLFSYHNLSEKVLFNIFSLFVSSHYKNQPNDIQLLSDGPGHYIFILLGPIAKDSKNIPDILCAAHVSLEGNISEEIIHKNSKYNLKPAGDLISWKVKDYFLDSEFPKLLGLRIVRIATNPKANKMGYGSKLLELLEKFFKNELGSTGNKIDFFEYNKYYENNENIDLNNKIKPKKEVPPILKDVSVLSPPNINYLGTSFGLTPNLYKFWKKNNYVPVYIKQSKTEETGENSAILLKNLKNPIIKENLQLKSNWLHEYNNEFLKRFVNLLSNDFKNMDLKMCIDILNPILTTSEIDEDYEFKLYNSDELNILINLKDVNRLEKYIKGNQNLSVIKDLIPILSNYYFKKKSGPNVKLSYENAMILLGLGLQSKSIEDLILQIKNSNASKIMSLLKKTISRITNQIKEIYQKDIETELDFQDNRIEKLPLKKNHDEVLKKEGKNYIKKLYN